MITDQDVRNALQAEAAQAPSRSGSLPSVIERGRRRRRLSLIGQLAAAFVALVAFVAIPVLLIGDGRTNVADQPPPAPISDPVTSGIIFPVPDVLPAGTAAVRADFAVPDAETALVHAALAKVTAGGLVKGTTITISKPDEGWATPDGEPIEINGRPGTLSPLGQGDPDGRGAVITWQEGKLLISVFARDEDTERALQVAEAVRLVDTEDLDASAVAIDWVEGLEIVAQPTLIDLQPTPYVTIEIPRPGSDHPGVTVEVHQEAAGYIAALSDAAQRVTVRRRPAYFLAGSAYPFIVWDEAPGLTVTVGGSIPLDELTRVAEGLLFVDEPTWRQAFNTDVQPRIPTTTTEPD